MPARISLSFGLFLLLACLVVGCSAGPAGQTELLLQREYRVLSDQELQSYYRQLGDQLVRETRARREAGLLAPAGESRREELLRERWNQVRHQLRERELLP